MRSRFPGAVPEIPVSDINAAVAYYVRNLGFTLDWGADPSTALGMTENNTLDVARDEGVQGEDVGLAGISRGDCRLFLASSDYRKGYGNVGPVLTWLNL